MARPRITRTPRPWEKRLEALETRLRRIEGQAGRSTAHAAARRYWILDALQRQLRRGAARREGGRLAYGGIVMGHDGSRVHWQGEHGVERLLGAEWDQVARGLAALGHRVRLELLRAVLRGTHEVQALRRVAGMGTTGQIYHHLRELRAAGWVRQQQRNRYVAVPDRVVAALVVVGAVMGPERPDAEPRAPRRRTARAARPRQRRKS